MHDDCPAAGVSIRGRGGSILELPMAMKLMDGKQSAECMCALLVTKILIDETQQGQLVKPHGRKETAPQSPGDRAVGNVIQGINSIAA